MFARCSPPEAGKYNDSRLFGGLPMRQVRVRDFTIKISENSIVVVRVHGVHVAGVRFSLLRQNVVHLRFTKQKK